MPDLTDSELRALAYYAIGVSSEGKDVAYRLSFAGHAVHGKDGSTMLEPIGNSGYSVGEMQTDLGQHPDDARALVDAFQTWAESSRPNWILGPAEQVRLASDLGRDGHHIRDANYTADNTLYVRQHGTNMPSRLLPAAGRDIDPTLKAHLNAFLATDDGKSFTNGLDVVRVSDLMKHVAEPLAETDLYKNTGAGEQVKLFAVTAKVYNQSHAWGGHMLDDIAQNKITSLASINARIGSFPDYMRTGRDAALAGAEMFNTLRVARKGNPLHESWQAMVADPLADPARFRSGSGRTDFANAYDVVKGLFVQPAQGQQFAGALERADSYDYGNPATAGSRGFYAEGKDFLQWDRDGQGRAFIGGQWSEFSRSELALQHNTDRTLDVVRTRDGQAEPLLHVTHPVQVRQHSANRPHAVANGALHLGGTGTQTVTLQARLQDLGYTDSRGHALQVDGNFGRETLHAVEAFQRDHGLAVDGKVGPQTQAALGTAMTRTQATAAAQRECSNEPRGFDDPGHPLSALYATLKERLPQGTSEARLAQATAACHATGINKPEDLGRIYSAGDGTLRFMSNSLFAFTAQMSIDQPTPTVQASLQQVADFDQQQVQAQEIAQQQAQQCAEPVMHQ